MECEDNKNLIDFYNKNDFEILPEYRENEIIVSIKEMLPEKQETISPVIKAIREIVAIYEENNNIDNDLLRLIKFI